MPVGLCVQDVTFLGFYFHALKKNVGFVFTMTDRKEIMKYNSVA